MVGHAAALVLAVGITLSGAVQDTDTVPRYEDLGECRITTYCPSCNDGAGHESSSGVYLEEGHAACRWLPNGTIISIDGFQYEVVDTCGMPGTIDIFIDDNSGECHCNTLEYRHVYIVKGAGR